MFFISFVLSQVLLVMSAPALFEDAKDCNAVDYDFPFVSRKQWHARTPSEVTFRKYPMPYVVIHHSYKPPACNTTDLCKQSMRSMQNFHMDDRGWWDIGYNFAVGCEGIAYEGRGWGVQGAHVFGFNNVSVGICLIGDWTSELPTREQMDTAQALIAAGVKMGHIKPNYKLLGHRQVGRTECPGSMLYEEIKKWKHYSRYPASVDDIYDLPEFKNSKHL